MVTRPAIFKWRQTEPGIILCAVRWYLRYSLSLRDVEELLEQRLRPHLKPTNKSWRVDETYVRVKGRCCYLYRAIDSKSATIDFLPQRSVMPMLPSACFARRLAIDPILNLE